LQKYEIFLFSKIFSEKNRKKIAAIAVGRMGCLVKLFIVLCA
jgi:hypothetical protein